MRAIFVFALALIITSVSGTMASAASNGVPAACGAQLDSFVDSEIAGIEKNLAEWKEIPPGDADGDRQKADMIAELNRDLASLRRNGANDPKYAATWAELNGASTKDLKQLVTEAGNSSLPGDRLAVCIAQAALAQKGGGSSAGTAVPPLRPTVVQEAHNPAGEATDCLEPIFNQEFVARGIKSTMEAVIQNTCARPVQVIWCVEGWDCKSGYSNLGAVPAKDHMPISYVHKGKTDVFFAGCYNGFVKGQGELSRKKLHGCK